jgi:hypothetical protein
MHFGANVNVEPGSVSDSLSHFLITSLIFIITGCCFELSAQVLVGAFLGCIESLCQHILNVCPPNSFPALLLTREIFPAQAEPFKRMK